MHLKYDTAFSVFFRHPFFTDGKLKTLRVQASVQTAIDLKRIGCVIKPLGNGFRMLYESIFNGRERGKDELLKENIELHFRLFNDDATFFNVTSDFGLDISRHFFHFKNKTGPQFTGDGRLHKNEVVGSDDVINIKDYEEKFFNKPFGTIDIKLHTDLESELYINFNNRSTIWRYILVKEYLQDLESPAVIHKNTREAFLGPEKIVLPDNRTGLAFRSPGLIALTERSEKLYQLVDNLQEANGRFKVILSMLPAPDINLISLINNSEAGDSKINFSEIFI